jgi:acyl-CoA synthetase (AMP-forming)/AMP-acid ligase II/aryl carrier-like protein
MTHSIGVQPPRGLAELAATLGRGTPLAPALLAPGRPPLDYGQLLSQLHRIGAAFARAGVGHEDRVAIILPNGPEMAVAALAAAAYAACAPLNPAYGEDELRFYLGDLRPKALILPESHSGPVRSVAAEFGIPCLDARWTEIEPAGSFELRGLDRSTPAAAPSRGDDEIALVLHTSGTTSRPKIVPLTQRNICRSAANIASSLRLTPEDRCLNVMPLFHVHGLIGALFASFSAGASVVCLPGMREGEFVGWLEEFRPSWYTAVPTIHEAVLSEIARHPGSTATHQLRFVRSSSAPLPTRLAAELESALGVPVIEAYGMTEAAHQIAINPLPPLARKPGSVGLAAGAEVAIRGAEGRLLPTGEQGEIVIRGDNVMRGYESDPEANQAAFIDGWFRTGDLGRLDSDGYLTITGRLKEIINRGGEKVSPRDVEEALLEHGAVRQAAAFAVSHPTLGEDVAAAVVLKAGASAAEDELRGFLFGRLPDFKIPTRIVIVDEIPKGSTGKIQRLGLADRLADRLATKFVTPRGDTETLVAALFAEVLGVEQVGATDNFFALGGDSLRGGQVVARVRARREVNLQLLTLFRKPTVAEFAREIEVAPKESESASFTPPPVRRR